MSAILLVVFAVLVWIGGGASRGDVLGQVLVRSAAWCCLVLLVLLAPRPSVVHGRVVLAFIVAGGLLAALQLVPLPPTWWAALPGRVTYAPANAIVGGVPPWRPLSITPSLTLNALGSLIVPLATVLLLVDARSIGDRLLMRLLLGMIVASMGLGLLQFAGIPLYVPLINGGDEISGNFANKNHYALVMAWGLLLVPIWAFDERRPSAWRAAVTLVLIPLLMLAILSSGSRAGMGLGLVALLAAIVLVHRPLRRVLRRYPPWVLPTAIGGGIFALLLLLGISFTANRALSINRALALDPAQDMRRSGLPTVWAMVREYFPFGSGFGTFDTVFRQHEPFHLLKLTYFNRAHNDFLEIVLDAGVFGLALVSAALGWWLVMTRRAWRASTGSHGGLARIGSILLLLVMLASIVDYPARTPMIMMMVVIAATWLEGRGSNGKLALRSIAPPL